MLLKWLKAFSVSLKILTTLYPSNILKYWKKNWNENQHHEQKDLISPFNRLSSGWWSGPVSQLIVRKTTSSELKASTTVILRDSVVKNVYDNIITKSVKHQNASFSGTKIADMNHCKKPTQEKSPVEIIIHEGTNYLSSDKKPKNIANDIIKFAKSVKTDADKVAVSRIPTRKDTINSKVKEVNSSTRYWFYK